VKALAEGLDVVRNGGRLVSIVDTRSEELAKAKDLRADFVFVQPSGEELAQIGALIDAGKVALKIDF
jgi:NADPH:quinone reductase-like Zn-dependent oxidoreductase